jgi:preprotein translocase subunit SecA
LNEEKISHYKLNAINHKQEAEIISKAGQKGSITISTNMAGRGTDIVLSDESREAGGLLVVGVERNMNRRIDDQLKGRSGRQGDPGESKFYVSLEDDLIKNFSLQSKVSGIFRKNKVREIFKKPVSGKMFNYLVSEPQESLKNMQSATRQNILNYDLLISKQRSFIYKYRRNILEGKIEYLKEKERNHTNDKDTTNNNEEKKTEIKSTLVKEVDMF